MCFLAAMMVPFVITLIPRFLLFRDLGFYDTYVPALIVPAMFGTPFSIFLTKAVLYDALPKELEEAALCRRMQPCPVLRTWQIFMPLCKPIPFQSSDGVPVPQFLRRLYGTDYLHCDEMRNLQYEMGLSSFRNSFTSRYDLIMAGSILALIPIIILFVCCQKYIVRGIAMSGMKG
ncbi:MAG: hypothetical protein ACLUUO_20315 [Sellimonas intestinalis]